MNVQTLKSKLTSKKAMVAIAVGLTVASGAAVAASAAVASDTANAFDPIMEEVMGWLAGAPGKIIATLAFGFALFNVVQQNFAAAGGAFVGALLLAFGADLIDAFFSAGI